MRGSFAGVALLLMLAGAVHAQRPGSAVLDLPGQVPDWGVMLMYGRGEVPVHGTVNAIGVRGVLGSGNDVRGAGAALLTGGGIDGTGWSVDAMLGRRLREPHGRWGRAVAARLVAAYSHAPAADGAVDLIDASAVAGFALQGNAPQGTLELWAAPRVQYRRLDVSVATDFVSNRVGPGLSWGLAYATRANVAIGFNIAGDVLVQRDAAADRWRDDWSFGVALHFLR